MISVDTNILVRLLTKDDPAQYTLSYNLFKNHDIFISDTVILETEWVLRYAYDYSYSEICRALRQVFGLKNVFLSNAQLLAKVIDWHENGLDFSDAFHLANSQHLDVLKTFDQQFIKRANNLSKCVVEQA